jgi:hypothetical protein
MAAGAITVVAATTVVAGITADTTVVITAVTMVATTAGIMIMITIRSRSPWALAGTTARSGITTGTIQATTTRGATTIHRPIIILLL